MAHAARVVDGQAGLGRRAQAHAQAPDGAGVVDHRGQVGLHEGREQGGVVVAGPDRQPGRRHRVLQVEAGIAVVGRDDQGRAHARGAEPMDRQLQEPAEHGLGDARQPRLRLLVLGAGVGPHRPAVAGPLDRAAVGEAPVRFQGHIGEVDQVDQLARPHQRAIVGHDDGAVDRGPPLELGWAPGVLELVEHDAEHALVDVHRDAVVDELGAQPAGRPAEGDASVHRFTIRASRRSTARGDHRLRRRTTIDTAIHTATAAQVVPMAAATPTA